MKKSLLKLLGTFLPLFLMVSQAFAYNVMVAKDNSGNFTTIQAAIDAAPTGNTSPYIIYIKNGKYKEVVTIPSSKPFLQLVGQSVAGTIISYGNYSGLLIPGGGGSVYGTSNSATVFFNADDCAAYNISIENASGYVGDGPQALAINVGGDRCVFKNCRFNSGQDTIYSGVGGKRNYFRNCYIDGNTDFIFGATLSIFDSCIIYGRDRIDGGTGGMLTAANTTSGQAFGYVFRNCKVPPNRGITSYSLGRPWQNGCPTPTSYPRVAYLNTVMGSSVSAAGWITWDACTNTSQIYDAEYKSKNYDGSLFNVSQRPSWSYQLANTDTASYTTANIFGSWNPCVTWSDLCYYTAPELVLSNIRAQRSGSISTISWNTSWPMSGITFNLYRSTDSTNYTQINTLSSTNDSIVAFSLTDGLPTAGTKYYYYVKATKSGLVDYNTYVAVVNVSVPLNGDCRSANSGPWTNNVSSTATISGGLVTGVTINVSPSGYTAAPTISFTAAPSGGVTATGTAILTSGVVTGVTITNAGSGYISTPTLTFSVTGVGGSSVWETYTAASSTWGAVALGTMPGSSANSTIRNGFTVTISTLIYASSLTIESGAVLNSISNALQGSTQTLRIGYGTSPVTAILKNDGLLGSTSGTNDGLLIEIVPNCKNFTITGAGITSIARFRPQPPNTNSLNVVIDQNMDFNLSNNVGLTGYYNSSSNTNAETTTITINANKLVRVTQPGSSFHNSSTTTGNPQGSIIYNINGTLDLSATTNAAMVPNSINTASSILMHIGSQGILKTGTNFTMTNTGGTTYGTATVSIDSGGIFDATKTTTFTAGSSANSGYVVLNGGLLRRPVANTNIVFPISPNTTSYNPITINNIGKLDKFVANVKITFDQPVPNASKVVSRQWTLFEDTVGNGNATLSMAWRTADQGVNFDPTASINIIRYNGSSWDAFPATITGAGTTTNPYVATAAGITSFSLFAVSNSSALLPLDLVSFKAVSTNNQVQTTWTTTNEINMKQFQVERSVDARSFATIGTVTATNSIGTNNYHLTDIAPLEAKSYYRLKMLDKDGSFTYSSIIAVTSSTKTLLLVYPNPVIDQLQVQHKQAVANAFMAIYSAEGKMLLQKNVAVNAQLTLLAVSALPSGIYLLRYTNGNEQNSVHFIKQ